jgi:hypothetical protein
VRYLQPAHNGWGAGEGRSRPTILHSLGREDQLDRAAIERLIGALTRLLDPSSVPALAEMPGDLVFTDARLLSGTFVLDALRRRLGIDARRGRPHVPSAPSGARLSRRAPRVCHAA